MIFKFKLFRFTFKHYNTIRISIAFHRKLIVTQTFGRHPFVRAHHLTSFLFAIVGIDIIWMKCNNLSTKPEICNNRIKIWTQQNISCGQIPNSFISRVVFCQNKKSRIKKKTKSNLPMQNVFSMKVINTRCCSFQYLHDSSPRYRTPSFHQSLEGAVF